MNVCRGGLGSSLGLKTFNSQSSNSPIVNYYTSGEQKFFMNNINSNGSLRGSFHDHNFNFSPSTIFNKRNSSSNTSLQMLNGGSTPSTNKGPNGMTGKTLQEKIEGNFVISPDLDLDDAEGSKENGNINEKSDDDEEEPKTGLYMLSFNSDDVENSEDDDKHFDNNNLGEGSNMPIQSRINKAMKKTLAQELSPIIKVKDDNIASSIIQTSPVIPTSSNQFPVNGENNFNRLSPQIDSINQSFPISTTISDDPLAKFQSKPINEQPQLNFPLKSFEVQPIPQLSPSVIAQQSLLLTKKNKKAKRLDPSSYNNLPLTELVGNLYAMASDQGGCRYLQKLIDDDPLNSTKIIYQALLDNLLKLVNDPFGNYLIQKIFSTLSHEQLHQVIYIFSPHFIEIGSNPHGTRVLQHLINFLTNDYLKEYFLSVLVPFVVPLLKDLNGTHIVQKFAFDNPKYANYINKIIIENSATLATNRHGCCVIQKYFELYTGDLLQQLLDTLIENCLMLVVDQFGNYVIQTILLMNNQKCGNDITKKITENVSYYAKHKYSSNVVEKCFDYCDGLVKQKLICTLIKPEIIQDLIFDEHGNYIIQKALSCSDSETQRIMLQIIVPLFDKLKTVPFGERIITRLTKTYPHFIKSAPGSSKHVGGKKKGRYNKGGYNNRGGKNYNNKKY